MIFKYYGKVRGNYSHFKWMMQTVYNCFPPYPHQDVKQLVCLSRD